MHNLKFTFFSPLGQFHFKISKHRSHFGRKKGAWFKTEFCLPEGILASLSCAVERVDMVCGDCEQAEDF